MNGQRGLTLVDALVAVALSSAVVLGAGRLLLSSFHTFEQVDRLGRQQQTLIYTATAMADRLRRPSDFSAQTAAAFHLVCRGEPGECRCTVQDREEAQPLVSFDRLGPGACAQTGALIEPVQNGVFRVALPLGPNGQRVAFHVTQRPFGLASTDALR
ncbi:PilW family protein [Halomonas sp. GD1P12]|uniref:PilW family protein n=1 Tax=Halomonas sp. GD1P12 TaxID=2982691 RepID=UPI0021E3D5C9|nr:prepilin-type cleavage/methylation domain-containing protein [Halomonas sp. GD1P12]UYF99404.1 prepilin-type cleavage/methylation domain-containing protein [Halomonas sp. GD1P12]